MDLLKQLNAWGNNSFLRYGLIDTILLILLILLFSAAISKYISHVIKKIHPRNQKVILKIKKVIIWIIAAYAILNLFVPAQAVLNPLLASGGILAVVLRFCTFLRSSVGGTGSGESRQRACRNGEIPVCPAFRGRQCVVVGLHDRCHHDCA